MMFLLFSLILFYSARIVISMIGKYVLVWFVWKYCFWTVLFHCLFVCFSPLVPTIHISIIVKILLYFTLFLFFSISEKIISDITILTNISCRSSALALSLTKRWAFMHYSSLPREFIWWFAFWIIHDWWHSGWFQQSRLDLMVTENIVRTEILEIFIYTNS